MVIQPACTRCGAKLERLIEPLTTLHSDSNENAKPLAERQKVERSTDSMPGIAAPRLLRAKEVARILGVTPWRVRALVASGDLPSIRLGHQGWHRFRLEDVERLIAGQERVS